MLPIIAPREHATADRTGGDGNRCRRAATDHRTGQRSERVDTARRPGLQRATRYQQRRQRTRDDFSEAEVPVTYLMSKLVRGIVIASVAAIQA